RSHSARQRYRLAAAPAPVSIALARTSPPPRAATLARSAHGRTPSPQLPFFPCKVGWTKPAVKARSRLWQLRQGAGLLLVWGTPTQDPIGPHRIVDRSGHLGAPRH